MSGCRSVYEHLFLRLRHNLTILRVLRERERVHTHARNAPRQSYTALHRCTAQNTKQQRTPPLRLRLFATETTALLLSPDSSAGSLARWASWCFHTGHELCIFSFGVKCQENLRQTHLARSQLKQHRTTNLINTPLLNLALES